MNKCRNACVVLLVFVLLGCSQINGYVDIARDRGLSKEYSKALNKWTRSETVYSQFETRIHVTATYRSQEFNIAYLKEYERIYPAAVEEKGPPAPAISDPEGREFILYIYTPEKDSNDFDKQNSIWKIFLIDDRENRIELIDVRRIRKITPVIESFFPYVNQYYGVTYRIRFPASLQGTETNGDALKKPLRLMITGVLGKLELAWN